MEWNYLVILVSAGLALYLVLMEVRRKARRNLTWRLLASVLAVAALTLIALPPTYTKKNNINGEREVVLLTEGYNKDSLSKFSDPVIIATDKQLLAESGIKNTTHIPAIDYYLAENPEVKSLHVIGTGLSEDELSMLKNTKVRFHESEGAFGFQKVNWQQSVKSGDDLMIAGTFNNSSNRNIKILLKGLSTTLDSTILKADSLASFVLNCTPRQLGKAIYYLVVTSGKDTLAVEKVPFEVEPVKPLSIFMLSSSPGFEVNFLKQWLAENNFSVALQSKISNGKYSTEFINMNPAPLNLQTGSLENFDVLIADETSMNQLSSAERSSIKRQVTNGLGLLVLDEEAVRLSGSFGNTSPVLPIADQENISISILGSSLQKVLPVREMSYLTPQPYDQPLVLDSKNRTLVTNTALGQGRIVFSTINNTYFLKLSGNTTDYSSFWSSLLEKAARKKRSEHLIKVTNRFPVAHEKTKISLQTGSRTIPKLTSDDTGISLKQSPDLPNQWTGAIWPVKSGWNTLDLSNDHKNFFVFGTMDWRSVRHSKYAEATRQFAEQSKRKAGSNPFDNDVSREKVPPVYLYLLFLACITYLWIETKFL